MRNTKPNCGEYNALPKKMVVEENEKYAIGDFVLLSTEL